MGKNKKLKILTIVYSVLILFFLFLIVLAGLIYGFNSRNSFVRKAEKIIPYPVAAVNQVHWITVGEFLDNAQSVRRFYENQDFSKIGARVDFTTPDGQKRLQVKEKQVLGKMIEDEAIQILAQKEGIQVSNQDLTDNVDKKLDEMGTRESVKEQMMRLYGWSIEDFKQKVVKPALYREALEKVFVKKYQNTDVARKKIEEAKSAIDQKQKSFSDIVAEFSDGSSAQTGGELGWFKKEQIAPEIAEQIFVLHKGEQSAILESPLGFHIVELEERKTDAGVELVRIRQIFAAKKTLADWVGEQMKTMKIWIPLKGYVWNNDKVQVDFTDKNMKDFEKQLMENPNGDASVIF